METRLIEGGLLASLLAGRQRFGVISVEITAQIANASLEQIEQWFDTAIDASFLTDELNDCHLDTTKKH